MCKDRKNFIFILNRDFDKFYNLTSKEKRELRKNITEMERKEHIKKYLEKIEEIYNRKNKEHLTYKQLAKIYNTSVSTIECYVQDIKIYIFLLDRNSDKFYNLSGKEKLKLRKKITAIDKQNNNILDIGKQIEDLKLFGVSNKDIAKKLNLSINRISDIYKKYKKLINDKEIKNELKSIKTIIN